MRRREFLLLPALALPLHAGARPNEHVSTTDPLIYSFTRGAPVIAGRVRLELPAIAETGYSVPVAISMDSPMTQADHVRALRLIAEKNPMRDVAVFWLGPHSGRAQVSSRIRLNGTQRVVAIAELSDGTFWSAAAHVEVREAACTEG